MQQSHRWNYAISRTFSVYKWSDSPPVNKAVNILLDQLNTHLGGDIVSQKHLKYRNTMKKVVLDLFIAHIQNPKLFVSYSRNRNDYAKPQRYRLLYISYRKLIQIVDFLEGRGYIHHKLGFFDIKRKAGRQSVMTALPPLITLLSKEQVTKAHIRTQRDEIVLRDRQDKKLINFTETKRTITWRANIQAFNSMLQASQFALELSPSEEKALIDRLGHLPDETDLSLCRIFNGTFSRGGRFYGPWVMNLPRQYRRRIRINGQPTCELDYSGLHINLLYCMAGQNPPLGDVYTLAGLDSTIRPLLKAILLISINAKNEASAVRAVMGHPANAQHRLGYKEIQALMRDFIQRHDPIRRFFNTGIGINLQFIDSCLAERVLLTLAKKGIVAVPIHDSFVCQAAHEQDLRDAMNQAFIDRFGSTIRIDRKP